ncbi:MAG: hypothetical protein ISR47_07755 [Rhodospirillales bacterium]|nr:hypothetical protein [Rhodospirillales bacterium]
MHASYSSRRFNAKGETVIAMDVYPKVADALLSSGAKEILAAESQPAETGSANSAGITKKSQPLTS